MLRSLLTIALATVLVAAAGYGSWRFVNDRAPAVCAACLRPIHGGSATVAVVNGRRSTYCCPACALSEHRQSGSAATVESMSDYQTGQSLAPSAAFIVRGSNVNPCIHEMSAHGEDNQPLQVRYDRCWPSLLAFSSRQAADGFSREHGGQVFSFADVEAQFH